MPYINEACYVLQEGIATKEDIDNTMKLGTNTPMGPLVLADFIGLDTCLAIVSFIAKFRCVSFTLSSVIASTDRHPS